MRLSHPRRAVSVRFDDPNLVSCGGLAAVLALAARCGLAGLVTERVRIAAKGGANAAAKIVALVAGMVAGADSITDMDLLRHGGMGRLFAEVRAPSTLGTFLRLFTFGHLRQLDAVAAGFLARLTAVTPVLSGVGQVAFLDVDDTVRAIYGYAKQGAGRGYTGVNGLNALLATISTPLSAPVIAATRLRRGAVNSVRGAARLLVDALACARRVGATGLVIVRADSAFYSYDIVAAARRAGARFSLTARLTPAVTGAITSIEEQAWTRSAIPRRSMTTTSSAGFPTPRSPRWPLPRSPAGAAPSTSPPG
jgi:Transposase DDE domain group 1